MIPVLAVQLGRIGDLLNILPPCRWLGIKHVLVHPQFETALRGQSYVEPVLWEGDIENLRAAVERAQTLAQKVVVPQLFGRLQPEGLPSRFRPSFVQDQWDRLKPGLGDFWGRLPLVFDQRSAERERQLVSAVADARPLLLVNLSSTSSPCSSWYQKALWAYLREKWTQFALVDVGMLRPVAYCDLLGLYDKAVGLITVDTASLHLAVGCPTLPVFRFIRPDHDATPMLPGWDGQPYKYDGMDRIEFFLSRLSRFGGQER
jgi:hypothetical protein